MEIFFSTNSCIGGNNGRFKEIIHQIYNRMMPILLLYKNTAMDINFKWKSIGLSKNVLFL